MTSEENTAERASSARHERLKALRAAREFSSMPDEDPSRDENNAENPARSENNAENPALGENNAETPVRDDGKTMTYGEDSMEHSSSARRERLKALRAAKEFSGMPDEDPTCDENNVEGPARVDSNAEGPDRYGRKTMSEEDPVEQASSARHERLKVLRAAKEFSSMPDEDPARDESRAEDPVNDQDVNKVAAIEEPIEHAAATRREMLRSLRMAKELTNTPEEVAMQNDYNVEDSEEIEENMGLKFRNYLPHDKQLQEGKLAPKALPKFEDPIAKAPPSSDKVEDPFVNIAPKKPNWDLRRDVQKKLDKLERRTQKALYELMLEQQREKESAENGSFEHIEEALSVSVLKS